MDVGSEGQGGLGPWIFMHGTDIIDRGLIVLFFCLFCYFSVFFPLAPQETFCRSPSLGHKENTVYNSTTIEKWYEIWQKKTEKFSIIVIKVYI